MHVSAQPIHSLFFVGIVGAEPVGLDAGAMTGAKSVAFSEPVQY